MFSAWFWRPGAPTLLNHEILANELLTDTDLRPGEQSQISNHFARKRMPKDSEIRPDDVSDTIIVSPSSLAVLARMDRNSGSVKTGDMVRLCLDSAALGGPVEVEGLTCDAVSCLVTAKLSQLPKELQSPQAAVGVKAIRANDVCKK